MFDHLRYRATRVETRSPAGELAERVLMFNDERSVEYRELVLQVIAALEEKERRLQETIRRIDQGYAAYPAQADQFATERAATVKDLERLQHHLKRVTGMEALSG
jgi:hypothetical protein